MARTLVAVAVLTLLALACKSNDTKPVGKYDPAADAAADFEAAKTEAADSKRRILMEVGGNWCSWTRRLDVLFESDQATAGAVDSGFVHVRINKSDENYNESFLSKFPKIGGYPHLFVLDAGGKVLHSQDTAELEDGDHHDPAKVLAVLKKWAPASE
jgi:hypothetical protein